MGHALKRPEQQLPTLYAVQKQKQGAFVRRALLLGEWKLKKVFEKKVNTVESTGFILKSLYQIPLTWWNSYCHQCSEIWRHHVIRFSIMKGLYCISITMISLKKRWDQRFPSYGDFNVSSFFGEKMICQSWIDDIGFSLTPPPLISTHIVNLQTPPPLKLADVFYGRPLSYDLR